MCRCWNDDPTARPTFDYLVFWIDDVIKKARRTRADSRLYLNMTGSSNSTAEQPPRCQPAVPPDGTDSLDAHVADGHVEEELCYR